MAEVAVARTPENRLRAPRAACESAPGMAFGGGQLGTNPFTVMREVAEELEKKFSSLRASNGSTWTPKVECRRANGALVVSAEVPGIKTHDVTVEITSEGLILEGERGSEHGGQTTGVYRSERSYGRFYRFIPLPEGVKTEEASAELSDGLLTVTVPLPEVKEHRRAVPVKSGK
jgi:HSP20 family protein